MDVGSCYYLKGDTINTIHYYNEALKLICDNHTAEDFIPLICEMLGFYSIYYNKEMADSCMNLIRDYTKERPINYNSNLAYYYEVYGPLDSAICYYLLDLNNTTNIIARKDAARNLMDVYRKMENYEQAAHYGELYAETVDSFQRILMSEQTMNAHNEYQYRRDIIAESEAYKKSSEIKLVAIAFLL